MNFCKKEELCMSFIIQMALSELRFSCIRELTVASFNIYNFTTYTVFIVSLVPIVLSLPVVRWIMDMIVIYMFPQQVLTCKSIPTSVTMLSASVIVGGEA